MAKVTSAYESVVRGVSEQSPADRREGQCWDQVNMISDPKSGNARRHGSHLLHEVVTTGAPHANLVADTVYSKTTMFAIAGTRYDLVYRTKAATGTASFAWCFNRKTQRFVPIVYETGSALLDALVAGGVSAAVNVGRYVYLAGNTVIPSFTGTDRFGALANQRKAVVWLRGGAYSRTFKVKVTKLDGTIVEASYKTAASGYPVPLDTSDILTADADYQKKVNDRVYAWNSAVTAWIGTAAEDTTPTNVAAKLALALTTLGITGVTSQGGTVLIDNADIKEITGDDGGDGSLIRAVGNEITAAELVSTVHWVGKIVKVRPQRSKGDDAYYLEAIAKHEGETGFVEVSWREAAGYVMQPTGVFAMGTVVDETLYLAGSPAGLGTLTGLDTPDFPPSSVGDAITSVLPSFFGKTITFLGLMQDRLVIGSGAITFMSRPGDYFDFFRQTVLSVLDTDPWEGFAQGTEDDTIRHAATYDRDLILFGDTYQYSISGRQLVSPKTGTLVVVVSKYEDTTHAAPQTSGNFIFYSKYAGEPETGELKATLHQVQAGQMAESPESFEVSQALEKFLQGQPVEILAMRTPHMVFLRTDADRHTLYLYSYLDSANASERLTDSWGRWNWDPKVGSIVGLSENNGNILVYLLRENAGVSYIACERLVRAVTQSKQPYLDSLRLLADAQAAPFLSGQTDNLSVALGYGTPYNLMGLSYDRLADFTTEYADILASAWVGFDYPASFTPTNPYTKDRQGNSITTGRLTLGRVIPTISNSGGLVVTVETSSGTETSLSFNGHRVGYNAGNNGTQPVITAEVGAVVGREIRECKYTLSAYRWLPFTVTAIGWSGQYFNNARRVS